MSEELWDLIGAMRQQASVSHQAYEEVVAPGEALTDQRGQVVTLATVYLTSRLVRNGCADMFLTSEDWFVPDGADRIRTVVEEEVTAATSLPDRQLALDLAFLTLPRLIGPCSAKAAEKMDIPPGDTSTVSINSEIPEGTRELPYLIAARGNAFSVSCWGAQ